MSWNYFARSRDFDTFPTFTGKRKVEVCIVGGGVFGLSTALELQRSGKQCVLLEARALGGGSSGNSQGVLATGYESLLSHIVKSFGEDTGKKYVNFANLGLQRIKDNITNYNIACDYDDVDFITYGMDHHKSTLEKEMEAAKKLGVSIEAIDVNSFPATFPFEKSTKWTVATRMRNMAQLNPLAYCYGLAKAFVKEGGEIFENTRVIDVKNTSTPHDVILEDGSTIVADNVVIATHLPILDRSGHFSMIKCRAGYQIILPLREAVDMNCVISPVDGAILEGKTVRWMDGGKSISILGFPHALGEMHHLKDIDPFEELRKFAVQHFNVDPSAKPLGKFFDFDYMSPDYLPYIGKLQKASPTIFTACGFNQWGFIYASAAPLYIKDLMNKQPSPFEIFDATRWDLLRTTGQTLEAQMKATKHLVFDRLKNVFSKAMDCEKLKPGEAGVCKYNGKTCGGYRNQNGDLCLVSLTCSHLGCMTTFNPHAKTYDCACHGSRYNLKGEVISGPTVKPLEQLKCEFTGQVPSLDILGKEDQTEQSH